MTDPKKTVTISLSRPPAAVMNLRSLSGLEVLVEDGGITISFGNLSLLSGLRLRLTCDNLAVGGDLAFIISLVLASELGDFDEGIMFIPLGILAARMMNEIPSAAEDLGLTVRIGEGSWESGLPMMCKNAECPVHGKKEEAKVN